MPGTGGEAAPGCGAAEERAGGTGPPARAVDEGMTGGGAGGAAEGDGDIDGDGDTDGTGEAVAAAWTGVESTSSRLAAITPNTGANRQEPDAHHRMPA